MHPLDSGFRFRGPGMTTTVASAPCPDPRLPTSCGSFRYRGPGMTTTVASAPCPDPRLPTSCGSFRYRGPGMTVTVASAPCPDPRLPTSCGSFRYRGPGMTTTVASAPCPDPRLPPLARPRPSFRHSGNGKAVIRNPVTILLKLQPRPVQHIPLVRVLFYPLLAGGVDRFSKIWIGCAGRVIRQV